MKENVLFVDHTSEDMEAELQRCCPKHMELKFLNPVSGRKGTLEEADYLIDSAEPVTREMLDRAVRLKMILRTGVGVDHVDMEAASEKKLPVCIAAGCLQDSVAELIIGHILSLYRKLNILDLSTRRGNWEKFTYKQNSFEIKGKIIGIIGSGRIGKACMEKLGGFFPSKIYYTDPYRMSEEEEIRLGAEYTSLENLMKSSDIVSISVPHKPENEKMINRELIDSMKEGALFINTARGSLVDYDALEHALREKRIGGAGLDVFSTEPVSQDDPILKLSNVSLSPHIGSSTYDCFHTVCMLCFENINRMQRGEKPLYDVTQSKCNK